MKKCIVTVLGKDTVGIIAKVCTYLAENEINILDISQTIVQGYFNMMVIADVTDIDDDRGCDRAEEGFHCSVRRDGAAWAGNRREHPLPERRDL